VHVEVGGNQRRGVDRGERSVEQPTPEGVVDVMPGDEVVCEIDGIGRLVNTIVGDDTFGR
jgi:hypothetical protein